MEGGVQALSEFSTSITIRTSFCMNMIVGSSFHFD